jgi:hypothetical protein
MVAVVYKVESAAAVVLVAVIYTVELAAAGVLVAFPPIVAVMGGNGFPASTHAVTSGKTVENIFASTPTSLNGGGRSGKLSPTLASIVREIFASTRTRGPSARRSPETCLVWFAYGADGKVALLLLPQFAAAFVESLASRRGRFIETETSAVSLSRNSKPTGMVGLKARPRRISTSVMLAVKGSGVRVDPGKPLTPLLTMSVSSRRMLELSGICWN